LAHNAGECEGDSKTGVNFEVMQAASPFWTRQLLAKVISNQIELAANQGGKRHVVEVSVT